MHLCPTPQTHSSDGSGRQTLPASRPDEGLPRPTLLGPQKPLHALSLCLAGWPHGCRDFQTRKWTPLCFLIVDVEDSVCKNHREG